MNTSRVRMTNKDTVEDLLVQFFGEEICNSASTTVISATEEWIRNSQNSLQEFIDDISENSALTSNIKIEDAGQIYNVQSITDSDFKNLFRMSKGTFLELQHELTSSRDIDCNLLACLCVLGSTKSFSEIASLLRVKQEQLFEICEQYFRKIIAVSSKFICWPNYEEVSCIEKGFLADFQFPGVVGVIGSIHIGVYMPRDDPKATNYFNKTTGNHTIVLQAVCDNNLLFRDIFAGYPGSHSITTILKASELYVKLADENSFLMESKKHLLGGTEHPQMSTLLTPYSIPKYRKPTDRELKFNMLHASVMYTVEKTFRMVENRFPRMRSLDITSPKFATLAAGAICVLHNFCRLKNDSCFC